MPSERGKVVALKKNVLDARRKADAKGLSSSDITEGLMRQSIAAATKASIGDTGLADAAQQARMDEGRSRLRDIQEGRAPLPEPRPMSESYALPPFQRDREMKRGNKPPATFVGGPLVMGSLPTEDVNMRETAADGMDDLTAMMGKLGRGRRRSTKTKKGTKGGKKKKGGKKTRRRRA